MAKTQLDRVLDKFERKLKRSVRVDYSSKELAAAGCFLDIGDGLDVFAGALSILMRDKISEYLSADEFARQKGIVLTQDELKKLLTRVFKVDRENAKEEYFCVKEVADYLGVTESTARRYLRSGFLASVQVGGPGGKILIPHSEIKRLMSTCITEKSKQEVMVRSGFVYVVRFGNHYKIGYSVDPISRISSLKVGIPGKSEIVCLAATADYVYLESCLHDKFKEKRIHGEWFELSEDDVNGLKEHWNFWTMDQIEKFGVEAFITGHEAAM